MAMITCPKCGKEISEKAKSCVYCGESFVEEKPLQKACPECGREIAVDVSTCPYCGLPFDKPGTKSRRKVGKFALALMGGLMVIIVAVIAIRISTGIKEKNTFVIEQNREQIELGESINLLSLITYDPQNITSVTLSDDGNFNSKESGSYLVIYDVVNKRDNHKQFSYTFDVVDTTAPKLEVLKSEVYMEVGSPFLVTEYAHATDASQTCEILFDESIDINKADTYIINAYAKDAAGNESKKQQIRVIYEEPRNCDVRNVCFGDDIDTVKRNEDLTLWYEDDTNILYEATLEGCEANLVYYFNDNNQMYMAGFLHSQNHTNDDKYVAEYSAIYNQLVDKYGKPTSEENPKSSMAQYCSSEGMAISLGYAAKQSEWKQDNMTIKLLCTGDNGDISLILAYISTTITAPEENNY